MGKVAYLNVDKDGRFSFHRADGSTVTVTGDKPYVTDKPDEIAYLDSAPFVKRAKAGGKED